MRAKKNNKTYKVLDGIIVENPLVCGEFALGTNQTTLAQLYADGWWITEMFGSYATVVKNTCWGDFISRQVVINTESITPRAQKLIDKIAKQRWDKFKHIMLPKEI